MTAITAFAAVFRPIWTRLAGRDTVVGTLASLGPNQCKEAGLASHTGASMR